MTQLTLGLTPRDLAETLLEALRAIEDGKSLQFTCTRAVEAIEADAAKYGTGEKRR